MQLGLLARWQEEQVDLVATRQHAQDERAIQVDVEQQTLHHRGEQMDTEVEALKWME